jgi:hypothetical protein
MWAQYSLYTLPLANGRLRKPEELPKERSLLDCMIHKAASEATAGKNVYLLAMDISETPLVRRITMLNPDLSSFLRSVNGKLVACTPPVQPRQFSPVHWFKAVPEEGATVVIYGADMIFNSYAAAVKALKEAQEEKNCEIIFAWRDEDMPAMPPPVFFEGWDELNVQHEKPIPVHTPFKLTKEECYSNPRLMQDPLLLYCPSKEIAYKLDPEDPWDRRLLDAFNSANKKA